ncbi:hybrid sensor histidine kinase/response regulator [Peredibacter starrii]|uniref:histidine kinase n=1 Tax=Peredibacter starrii TaxID=28202 RepID=A0AAX4HT83_9BACT|nr:ATP-binding protein [Peredibacter starrii]WPU66180.1 ATP-binding protein [Peredibacter starrii]
MNDFLAFDHLFDPVVVMNQKQELVYFNNQASIFFKLPPRVLKQKNHLIQLCDSVGFDIEDWLSKALLSFDVLISPEIKMTLPHDPETEYFIILKLVPVQSDKGANFAVIFHDKTVETNLHSKYRDQLEELKKTHSQILQADKLTTLGELTANISHEINNPLTIAAGHSEIIKDYLGSANLATKVDRLKSANQTVLDSLERVNQIIKNMKDFLHQSEEQKEYCDLANIVEASIEWIGPTAKKANVSIERDYREHPVVLVNRIKLEQVVINLIKNSIDAISETGVPNGIIKITLSKSDTDQQTYLDIVDNGPGMPEAIKQNLFKPFQSTKDVGKGTGLGLSICAKIIESHRGRLELMDSQKGCHFRIRLPLIEAYSYTRNDKSLTGKKDQKRILVLDNEVQILNVLNTFIADAGYVFIGSSDPHDALSFLQKADIDLIVTDFHMPIMTGSEFSYKAREIGYQGPILYMTSSKFIEQFNKDKKDLDIGGLIIKPFSRDDVMKTIALSLKPKESKE